MNKIRIAVELSEGIKKDNYLDEQAMRENNIAKKLSKGDTDFNDLMNIAGDISEVHQKEAERLELIKSRFGDISRYSLLAKDNVDYSDAKINKHTNYMVLKNDIKKSSVTDGDAVFELRDTLNTKKRVQNVNEGFIVVKKGYTEVSKKKASNLKGVLNDRVPVYGKKPLLHHKIGYIEVQKRQDISKVVKTEHSALINNRYLTVCEPVNVALLILKIAAIVLLIAALLNGLKGVDKNIFKPAYTVKTEQETQTEKVYNYSYNSQPVLEGNNAQLLFSLISDDKDLSNISYKVEVKLDDFTLYTSDVIDGYTELTGISMMGLASGEYNADLIVTIYEDGKTVSQDTNSIVIIAK